MKKFQGNGFKMEGLGRVNRMLERFQRVYTLLLRETDWKRK